MRFAWTSLITILATCVLAIGCASSSSGPAEPGLVREGRVARSANEESLRIENETVAVTDELTAPAHEVWNATVAVYEALELPITTRVPGDGLVAAQEFRLRRVDGRRASRFVDCGNTLTGPFADQAFVTANVVSRVTPTTPGASTLTTEISATARARDSATGDLFCSTTGRLERLILERVALRLGT